MKQVVLKVPDSEYQFFMKVIKSFSFVEIDEKLNKLLEMEAKLSLEKRKTWGRIKSGYRDVEMMEKQALKEKTGNEFLNEL
ncbi:MAG: hypothetical protein K0B11_22305 [Mariniphaga sp.]|nr:hypothetical protein [Mariniphaga sp.]